MKALLTTGIVLVILGIGAGFAPQTIETLRTGLPSTGVPWMQATGFVLAAIGAIMIGSYIGKRRSRKKREQ